MHNNTYDFSLSIGSSSEFRLVSVMGPHLLYGVMKTGIVLWRLSALEEC